MSDASQVHVEIQSRPLASPTHVMRLELVESLDEPFVGELWLRIHDVDFDVVSLLGEDMIVTLTRGKNTRRFCGLIRSVSEGAPGSEWVTARVELRPALWALSLRRDTRMFQEMSVPDILQSVLEKALSDHGRSVQLDLSRTYPTREYCMQYQESDLEFVQRLLSEEGIHYTFDCSGDVELLLLSDSNDAFATIPNAERIPFRTDTLAVDDDVSVERFARSHDHTNTSVVARDFDWTAAAPLLEGEARSEDAAGRDRESFEHGIGHGVALTDYDSGARRYQKNDVDQQVRTRQEAHAVRVREAQGRSRTIGLAPGVRFELFGHPTVGLDGDYYLTRVRHSAVGGDARHLEYENALDCRPLDVVHRPVRRAKPTISSIQSAVVTGPSGEEIHTDEHGRVKVQFHWDRENPADETSSCWVRCQQAWAGPGWGFFWVPRIGMEVVVHFVDGDPDRPLLTGCVYNGENRPPYELPAEKTKSTIKSNSSPGGGGFNEVRFEDKAGSEEIFVHAQKDYNEIVLNNHTTTVHNDQTNEVDNDQTQKIGNDQTETVHGNQTMSVGANRSVHVSGNFDETVDGTESRHTSGDVTETFSANETRDVSGAVTEDIGASETRTVGGSQTESVGASHTLSVAAASTRTVAGSHTATIGANLSEDAPAGYNITATAGFNVTVTGPTTWTTSAVTLTAPGGVRWIDSSDFWFGGAKEHFKALDNATFNVKLELGTIAYGISGVVFEQVGICIENESHHDKSGASRLKMDGAKLESGAFKKWLGALAVFG